MIEVRQTAAFAKWFKGLKDIRARVRILQRLERAEAGNLGDVKFFDGIGEMRIKYGPGYRLYFVARGEEIIILLCGGDKKSQRRDIKVALEMVKELD